MPILARFTAVNLLPYEHIVKMVDFIEKHPVTSSSYETMKNASILMKLETNVDWKMISLTACSILNFLLPWHLGYFSKLRKITILHYFFPCTGLNFLLPWQRGGYTITVYCKDLLQFLPFLLKLIVLAISFISYYSK
jgi:hypothetical protein